MGEFPSQPCLFSFPDSLPFRKITVMATKEAFIEAVKNGYTLMGESVQIGAGVLNG